MHTAIVSLRSRIFRVKTNWHHSFKMNCNGGFEFLLVYTDSRSQICKRNKKGKFIEVFPASVEHMCYILCLTQLCGRLAFLVNSKQSKPDSGFGNSVYCCMRRMLWLLTRFLKRVFFFFLLFFFGDIKLIPSSLNAHNKGGKLLFPKLTKFII